MLKVPGTGRGWRILLAFIGVAGLLLILFAGTKNLPKLMSLHRERKQLTVQIEEAQAMNQRLSRQIQELRVDPRAVEPIAREELGLASSNEWVYRFVQPENPPEQRE